ncbi:sulfur carrier protein ThiS [Paenibacillus sp. FSL K6-1230]|uniref:sulfur carrier protein ThiS n=1 Tax=Paenibacillus sp. FSL K6-1230 TaxID=2921603 RepID=UPI0003A4EA1F
MRLKINGQDMTFGAHINRVDQLLSELDLQVKTVVVELNRRILVRDMHHQAVLCDGDRIEIVHFVGGG